MERENIIRRHFDRTMRLLELGPSYNPVVSRVDGWDTTIVDHADQAELITKYTDMNVPTDRIEPVNYVWQSGSLAALIPAAMHGSFDGLVASHVGEHFPDLIAFFHDASTLVRPDGLLALALPDKRVCFDFFQPLTTTGDLVDAHHLGRTRHQRRTIFNHVAYFATRNADASWAHTGSEASFSLVNSIFDAQQAYENASEDPTLPYRDCHAWAFTPKSFELLMLELNLLGHIDWSIRSIESAAGVEFYVWLERKRIAIPATEVNSARLSLLTAIVYEGRDAIAQLDRANPATGATEKKAAETAAKTQGHWPGTIPSIAVIIPLYNGARYIEEALDSVFRQSVPATEVIVVDDGSTDDGAGAQIVERLAKTHPITLLRKPNGGQSSARNFGVSNSRSELIAFLDQDDIWYDNHLRELSKPFQTWSTCPLGWVYSNLDEVDESGSVVCRDFLNTCPALHPKRDVHDCIRNDMFVLPSAALVYREAFEAVGGFDEQLCGYEDDDLFLRIFRAGYDNIFLNTALSKWRIYPHSTSYSPRMVASRRIYARKLLEQFPDDPTRGRFNTRDLIVPRFGEFVIQDWVNAVKQGSPDAIAESWSEILFLAQYDQSIASRLFPHTLVHYRDALIKGNNKTIAAAWVEMAAAAAKMPELSLRTRVALKLLRNPQISKSIFAFRRLVRPATRWTLVR